MSSSPASAGKSAARSRAWTFLRILNVRLRFIVLMVLVGLVAGYWDTIANHYDRWRRPVQKAEAAAVDRATEHFCPMHPAVIRGEPGSCPICGMPLSQRAKSVAGSLPEGVLARVQMTPWKVSLGRIATTPAQYRLLSREIRTVGFVDYDETRRAFIAARMRGRIEKLNVNFVGQRVEQGSPLASIYSPDLLVAQEELLAAARNLGSQKGAGDGLQQAAQALLDAAQRKLLLWGITPEQIDALVRRGKPETESTIYSPLAGIVTEKMVLEGQTVGEGEVLYTIADLSGVWLQAKVFEDQATGVQIGTAVEVESAAFPGEIFAGRINFVAFAIDLDTRTVTARVEVANPDYKLKPGMYVNAVMRLPVGEVMLLGDEAAATTAATEPAPATLNTQPLARAYLDWMASYAQDKVDAAAAARVAQAARALAELAHGDCRAVVTNLAGLVDKMRGQDLKPQRVLLKELNARLIEFLGMYPPQEPPLLIAHCPMVAADWLQEVEQISNPYYGSEMLRCGEIVGPLRAAARRSEERHATGYYCPIYPDRLFEKPQHCPVDKFPTRLARVEKVLAVPESAVVNTGTRRIVYRESAPGTFDMVEVRLGPRAGEFYPVLAGLEAGDAVATAGAFLVDAENRLNPAAGAQYFGASGGPQPRAGE